MSQDADRDRAIEAVRELIRWAGDDPDREGLAATPDRVLRAYTEWFSGYHQDPAKVLERRFSEVGGYDQVIVLGPVSFTSHCEHHLAPFSGTAHVAYLPGQEVVGLSKLARLVDVYARRLQVQERLTQQVASALVEHLGVRGVAVVIRASHGCMSTRGVRKTGAVMTTSAVLGAFRKSGAARAEVLALMEVGGG